MRSTLTGLGVIAFALTACTGAPTGTAGFVPQLQAHSQDVQPAKHPVDTSGGGPVLMGRGALGGYEPFKHPVDTSGGGPVLMGRGADGGVQPFKHPVDTSGGGPVLKAIDGGGADPFKHPVDTSGGGPVLR
jgi:hypothetical protein